MRSPICRVVAGALTGWIAATVSLAAPADDLLAAATIGDPEGVARALAAGAAPDARTAGGETPLMLATSVRSFGAVRALLWAGADANAKDPAGAMALARLHEVDSTDEPLQLLLRSYAYLQTNTQRTGARPTRPTLVLIMEDTVNYLHPQLAPLYHINTAELHGKAGADDDNNGFVDDIYGWEPEENVPYHIRPEQFETYLKHRNEIASILSTDAARAEKRIPEERAQRLLAEYTNPLARIMGPVNGLNDAQFLDLVRQAAHGTHVAGIVVEASEGRAQLHTLAQDFAEGSLRPLGPLTGFVSSLTRQYAHSPEDALGRYRAALLARRASVGRTASRYIRATGAGVANLSFGGGSAFWRRTAQEQLDEYLTLRRRQEPGFTLEDEATDALLDHWGREYYVASTAALAIPIYENPDVLFVCSAGNDRSNNDYGMVSPAYLSRFFPNVITVASTDPDGTRSGFSNHGRLSVDVGAPGRDIRSTVIPEAPLYLSGTSMAAPYVAGVAALVRSLAPATSAAELRLLLAYSVDPLEALENSTNSGGRVNRETLRALFAGEPRARAQALARMGANASARDPGIYPRRKLDAAHYTDQALALDSTNALAWQTRALIILATQGTARAALEAIDRSLQFDRAPFLSWAARASIQEMLGDGAGVVASLTEAISRLEQAGPPQDPMRSRLLAGRAKHLVALGRTTEARADARTARALNEWVFLTSEVEALLAE